MAEKPVHFQGLNGIRAIAALAVVVSHARSGLADYSLSPVPRPDGLSLAGFGVSIFFVLSGFLITWLLQEEAASNPIHIGKFYLRRVLRIWPLYYLYFFIAVIVAAKVGFGLERQSFFLYTFFAANISFLLNGGLPFLSHYWSLGVEEQFYLFWPWMNKYLKQLLQISCFLVILTIVLKTGLHLLTPESFLEKVIHVCRFHCMLMGAIAAILYKRKHSGFLNILGNKLSQLLAWIGLGFVIAGRFHIFSVLDNELVSVLSVVIIVGQVEVKNRLINLEVPFMTFLGRISYSIYVIHPLLIFFLVKHIDTQQDSHWNMAGYYAAVILLTISVSVLSYYILERPFLKIREKFQMVSSRM